MKYRYAEVPTTTMDQPHTVVGLFSMKIITKFIMNRRKPKVLAKYRLFLDKANLPIISSLEQNFRVGIRAKGSYTLCRMLSQLSRSVRVELLKNTTPKAGRIAMALVIITLCHTGSLISKKPSITNCPA
jgi:hypothetical protein